MGKKAPPPPPAPDYAAAAQQQGVANLEAARLTARLSNPNVITPLGGQRVTFGRPQFNMNAYNAAMADWRARQEQAGTAGGAADSVPTTADAAGGMTTVPPTTIDQTFTEPAYGGGKVKTGMREPYPQMTILPSGNRVPTSMLTDYGLGGGRLDISGMGPGAATRNPSFSKYGYTGDVMPTPEMFTDMVDLDTPTIEQYLTPEAQATLEAQQRVERALSGLGEQAIGKVGDIYGSTFTPQGLPEQQFRFDGGGPLPTAPQFQGQARADVSALPVNFGPAANQYGMAQGGPAGMTFGGLDTGGLAGMQTSVGPYGVAQGGPAAPALQGQLDVSNLAAMPVQAGTTAQAAIMSRLDPQLQRQRAQLETQLANQGLVRGGEAYDAAMLEQGQRENDLRTQAAIQGLQLDMHARQQGLDEAQARASFAQQAALAGFGAGQQAAQAQNAAIGQNISQAIRAGEFANQAQAQEFAQRLAAGEFGRDAQMASFQTGQAAQDAVNRAIAQNFQQGLQAQGAYNAAAAQQFGQAMDVAGLYNAALAQNQQAALQQAQAQAALQSQGFNQAQAMAAFQNAQRQAALQEQLALRAQPLNEIAAIMGGAQVQIPQFQAYQGAEVGAAPIFNAARATGDFAQQSYANQVAAYNAKMGLYGNIAGGLGTAAGGGAFKPPT